MNIPEILDAITKAIQNFQFGNLLKGSKLAVIIFAAIAMAIILFGFLFGLVPQF